VGSKIVASYHTTWAEATVRRAWIGLGSNLGDRHRTLQRAVRWLDATSGVRVERTSRFRETLPVGPPQPVFLNGAVRVATTLAPMALLGVLRRLEFAAGRVRRERWGPRTLDLDLLLFDELVFESPTLTVPHPGLASRSFALRPLCELDPELMHPVLDRSLSDLLEALPE
jgi:2-amino-4-hydroxy-6-hydroxymethyldihydropteridine diphosphokinase